MKPFRAFLGGENPKRGRRRRRRRQVKPLVKPFTGCFGSADVNGKAALDPKKVTVNPIDQSTVTFGQCIGESRREIDERSCLEAIRIEKALYAVIFSTFGFALHQTTLKSQ